jgi:hypothetical protein
MMADETMFKNFLEKVQKGIVNIRFEKVDGTQTDRNVTLDPSYIPEEHPGVGQPEYEDLMESLDDIMHRDYLRVYSVSNQGWRTIKPSKLISWISA